MIAPRSRNSCLPQSLLHQIVMASDAKPGLALSNGSLTTSDGLVLLRGLPIDAVSSRPIPDGSLDGLVLGLRCEDETCMHDAPLGKVGAKRQQPHRIEQCALAVAGLEPYNFVRSSQLSFRTKSAGSHMSAHLQLGCARFLAASRVKLWCARRLALHLEALKDHADRCMRCCNVCVYDVASGSSHLFQQYPQVDGPVLGQSRARCAAGDAVPAARARGRRSLRHHAAAHFRGHLPCDTAPSEVRLAHR